VFVVNYLKEVITRCSFTVDLAVTSPRSGVHLLHTPTNFYPVTINVKLAYKRGGGRGHVSEAWLMVPTQAQEGTSHFNLAHPNKEIASPKDQIHWDNKKIIGQF